MAVSKKKRQMDSEHVRATRMGDLFHYRWAATRALRLVSPDSDLQSISVEGGTQPRQGDYIIDVEENYRTTRVIYQLKYSTKYATQECSLSFLGSTLAGFGKLCKAPKTINQSEQYVFLTNRPVSPMVKKLFAMAPTDDSALAKINKYLQLPDAIAQEFCRHFRIIDSVEDSSQQLRNVECRLMALTSSPLIGDEARAFVEFIAERASSKNHVLTKASILSHLSCSCEDDLFPAKACYDTSFKAIETDAFTKTLGQIRTSRQSKIVIHAAGGFGKTAFLRWLHSGAVLEGASMLFDCYGGGLYRSSNNLRHRIRDAFVEVVNELYAMGLCDPILRWQAMPDETISTLFWRHISEAVGTMRRQENDKVLYLLIDAADNANIAAQENGNSKSFVDHLIRARIPDGCRIVFTARTERLHFTDDADDVLSLKLGGFTTGDVGMLLATRFHENIPQGLAAAVKSVTRGNPRVILNLLSLAKTIDDLEGLLSPDTPKTLPEIMARKIDDFVRDMKRNHDKTELDKLDMLFDALAVLPPTISISVLAKVSGVETELIESFIAGFGTSFWFDHDMVHFRDEPTETFFRRKYGKSVAWKRKVLLELEQIGPENSYAALVIPKLLFELGDYDRLFELAGTKKGIPASNKTETRHLWLLRLEYAYRAALKLKRFPDAISLAFLLASENCGDDRQKSIVLEHLPSIAKRISEDEVEFLCRDSNLAWGWNGSHNLVVAVLKGVRNAQSPMARSYLQSTMEWMRESYETYAQKSKELSQEGGFGRPDVFIPSESEIALVAMLICHIDGIAECARFIGRWRPAVARFKIARAFALGELAIGESVDALLALSDAMETDAAVNLALNLTLTAYGKNVSPKATRTMISFLKSSDEFSDGFQLPQMDFCSQAILAACEVAARVESLRKPVATILKRRILLHTPYVSRYLEQRNYAFLRACALFLVVTDKSFEDCDWTSLVHKRYRSKTEYEKRSATAEISKRIDFYIESEKYFVHSDSANLRNALTFYAKMIGSYEIRDWERWELDADCVELKLRAKYLGIQDNVIQDSLSWFSQKIRIRQMVDVARRLVAFGFTKDGLAYLDKAYALLFEDKDDFSVEEMADWLMNMSEISAKANDSLSKRFYDKAFDILSAVGNDVLQHFSALNALMRRACERKIGNNTIARYLRCVEHAFRHDAKHFDSERAFVVLAKNNMPDALAALSRFRDKGFYPFGYVLESLLESLVREHGFTCQEVWALRFFLNIESQAQLLEFALSETQEPRVRQRRFDAFVDTFSKCVEDIDDGWLRVATLANQYSLNTKRIQPYVLAARRKKQHKDNSLMLFHKNNNKISTAVQGIDYSSESWLADIFKKAGEFLDGASCRELLHVLPREKLPNLLEQISPQNGVSIWNACDLLKAFPQEELGDDSKQKWDTAVGKIVKCFASEGEFLFLNKLVKFFSSDVAKQAHLSDCLSDCAEAIGIGSDVCYAMIELASFIVKSDDAEQLAINRIDSFEAEINRTLGDAGDEPNGMPIENPYDAVAGLLWSALGSPVAWYRWNATYCVSALLEEGCDAIINSLLKCHTTFDVKCFLSSNATFYDGFAEMFFAIAIHHAAAKCIDSIATIIPWLIERSRKCHNVVIVWHYFETLRLSNESHGEPSSGTVEEIRQKLFPQTPPIMLESWGDCLPYAWDASTLKNEYHIAELDVDAYWLPPLARIFGIEERAFRSLFKRAFQRVAKRHANWDARMRYGYDKRDYLDESVSHSHGSYPCAFAFVTYVSFIALMELAYELLSHFPVVTYPGARDEWRNWLNEHLLERPDGLWLSDEQDPVPVDFVSGNNDLKKLSEDNLSNVQPGVVLRLAAPENGFLPVGGGWETTPTRNRISMRYFSVLVPRGEGKKYVQKLRMCKDKYGYPVPSLFADSVEPPFKCKGKWRGLLQATREYDWSHFEQYDPNYGGFDRHQIFVDCEIQKLFSARRENLGKSLYCGRDEIVRLVRWGTGLDRWKRHRDPTHVGSVLWMSRHAFSEIEKQLDCEIILGANIRRWDPYRHDAYDATEQVYIWDLAVNCMDRQ